MAVVLEVLQVECVDDGAFFESVRERHHQALDQGYSSLAEFYDWVRIQKSELNKKLDNWPTFPKNLEEQRLSTLAKVRRLKELEDSVYNTLQKWRREGKGIRIRRETV